MLKDQICSSIGNDDRADYVIDERVAKDEAEASLPPNIVKKLMTAEEFSQNLKRIASAATIQVLANIRHESPDWDHMNEKMCSESCKAFDKRRIFLSEEQRLRSHEMSPYERAQYIATYHNKPDADLKELVRIAREVQAHVTKGMSTEDICRKPQYLPTFKAKRKNVGDYSEINDLTKKSNAAKLNV